MKAVFALFSAAALAGSVAARPQMQPVLDFFDLVPIMMVNQTAALTIPLSKRQECANGWKQCSGVGCIPPESVCCEDGSYCAGTTDCVGGGTCCPTGWQACSGTNFCAPETATCCLESNGYCSQGFTCVPNGGCCPTGRTCSNCPRGKMCKADGNGSGSSTGSSTGSGGNNTSNGNSAVDGNTGNGTASTNGTVVASAPATVTVTATPTAGSGSGAMAIAPAGLAVLGSAMLAALV